MKTLTFFNAPFLVWSSSFWFLSCLVLFCLVFIFNLYFLFLLFCTSWLLLFLEWTKCRCIKNIYIFCFSPLLPTTICFPHISAHDFSCSCPFRECTMWNQNIVSFCFCVVIKRNLFYWLFFIKWSFWIEYPEE